MSADETSIRKKHGNVPDALIYEIDEGTPIYYAGYKDVVRGKKPLEAIMGSSALQAAILMLVSDFLRDALGPGYLRLASELGFMLGKKSQRSLDLAIYNKENLPDLSFLLKNKYVSVAPEMVVEVDTKADLTELTDPTDYFYRKTDQLLDAGVEKVLWIFTASRKWVYAQRGQTWAIGNWADDVEIFPTVTLNIEALTKTLM